MVDPITDTVVANSTEGAVSVGVEAAKAAAETVQTSAVKGAGEAAGGSGGYGPTPGGTPLWVGSGNQNLNEGPMPKGFVSDPAGGNASANSSPRADEVKQPKEQTFMRKVYEAAKDAAKFAQYAHKAERMTSQFGKDLMGSHAHANDPLNKVPGSVHSIEGHGHSWDKWTR